MSRSDLLFHIAGYFVYTLILLLCAYPFYYLLICTISDNSLVNLNKITIIPKGIHFDNYLEVLKLDRIKTSAVVSVLKTALGTGASLLVTSYMAWFFTKENLWHRKLFYRLTIATMYFSAGMIPIYLNIKMLGLLNNFWVYVIPHCISVYNMILVKTYMESLPASLEESAEIDGAGYMVRFFRIVLPLSKTIIAVIALWNAVGFWNSYFTPFIYINDNNLYPLQLFLREILVSNDVSTDLINMEMAAEIAEIKKLMKYSVIVVSTAPLMFFYPFAQKHFVKGVMIGSVKG